MYRRRPRPRRQPDLAGRKRRVQPHHDVELVLLDHLHLDAAQQLAQHEPLGDALALAERCRRMSSTSSQFFHVARCSSLQNFERALSAGQSTSVSVKPRAFQSAARRDEVLRDVEAELPLGRPASGWCGCSGCAAAGCGPRPAPPCSRPASACPIRTSCPARTRSA